MKLPRLLTVSSSIYVAEIWALLFSMSAFAAAPDNDNFANRRLLVGTTVQDVADNTGATIEPGEPVNASCIANSLWWSWTAPASGTLNVRTYDFCSVWSGDALSSLTLLASNCAAPCSGCRPLLNPGLPPPSILDVSEGETVQIMAASTKPLWFGGFYSGPLQLNLDFSTVRLLEPTNGTSIRAGVPLTLRLSPPAPPTDGAIGVPVFVINSGSQPPSAVRADTSSFSAVVSNLPPDDYTVFAQFTNGANRLLTTLSRSFRIRPANDDFAAPTEVTNLPAEYPVCFRGATSEPGEPIVPGQGLPASLWWKWVASRTGELWITAPVTVAVGAFTGDQFAALTLRTNGIASLVVPVEAGTTYYFKAASTNLPPPDGLVVRTGDQEQLDPCFLQGRSGSIRFALRPANDDFENRKVLVGTRIAESGDNSVATTQAGEPPQSGTRTVWWSWTAPADGLVSLVLDPPGAIVGGAVWQGDTLTNLNLVTATELPFGSYLRLYQFEAHEGETYHISVGDTPFTGDSFGIRISFTLDLCSMRIVQPADGAQLTGPTNLAMVITPPRPDVEGEINHLVFQVMTTATRYCCSIFGADFHIAPLPSDPLTGVFTNLPPNEYWIYAQMTNSSGHLITTLTNRVRVRPPNDDFAAATQISGLPFSAAYQLASASDEPGEPDVSSRSLPGSVWWRWTALETGVVVAQGNGPVGAFVGNSPDQLMAVGFAPAAIYYEDVLRLFAEAGKTYFFKINPWLYPPSFKAGMQGTFALTQAWPNDDFTNRVRLVGNALTINVPNVAVSFELNEPLPDPYLFNPGSLWWTWTAPANGFFFLESATAQPPLATALDEVFSGDRLGNLSKLELLDSPIGGSLRITSGQTLQLALNAGGASNAVFRLQFLADPPPGGIGPPARSANGYELSFLAGPQPGATLTVETSSDLISWMDYLTLGPDQTNSVLIGPIFLDFRYDDAQFFRMRRP